MLVQMVILWSISTGRKNIRQAMKYSAVAVNATGPVYLSLSLNVPIIIILMFCNKSFCKINKKQADYGLFRSN